MGTTTRPRASLATARDAIVVLSTAPDTATGERIARALVEARLAACVNVVPGLVSIYRWKGSVSRDPEVLCVIKTRRTLLSRMAARLREVHPHEVPEILAIAVQAGARPYLEWLLAETRPESRKKAPAGRSRSVPKQREKKR